MQAIAIFMVLAAAAFQAIVAQTESQKIEALIRHVESLKGAKLIGTAGRT